MSCVTYNFLSNNEKFKESRDCEFSCIRFNFVMGSRCLNLQLITQSIYITCISHALITLFYHNLLNSE